MFIRVFWFVYLLLICMWIFVHCRFFFKLLRHFESLKALYKFPIGISINSLPALRLDHRCHRVQTPPSQALFWLWVSPILEPTRESGCLFAGTTCTHTSPLFWLWTCFILEPAVFLQSTTTTCTHTTPLFWLRTSFILEPAVFLQVLHVHPLLQH